MEAASKTPYASPQVASSLVDQAPSPRPGYVIGCTIVASLGGLLFGFDTAVISGAEQTLKEIFQSSAWGHGLTVASALIGTILGAAIVGWPADRIGRKVTLIWIAVIYFVSAVGSAFAWDWWSFVFFRFIGGVAVGGSSVVAPMYIAEISPARLRGRLVAVMQFNIVMGILVAFISNWIIARIDLGGMEWRWMFGVEAFPAVAFFALLFLTPRSPRWLVSRGLVPEARRVLAKVGTDRGDPDAEIAEIERSIHAERNLTRERFFQRRYRSPILLAFAIAAFNQLSGINAVMYYAPRILQMAGAGEEGSLLSAVAIGAVNLIFTMIAMALIDFAGRRTLMLVGSIGYLVSLSVVAATFYVREGDFGVDETTAAALALFGLLGFIASHAFGQGAVIWVFISEIFPNAVRARGQAFGSFTHWIFAAAISWTFPAIAEISGGHIFAFYAVCMLGQLLWVLFVMPETKGVPLEQIEEKLGIRGQDGARA